MATERVTLGEGFLVLLAETLVSQDKSNKSNKTLVRAPVPHLNVLRSAAPTLKLESKLDIGCSRGWNSTESCIQLDTLADNLRLFLFTCSWTFTLSLLPSHFHETEVAVNTLQKSDSSSKRKLQIAGVSVPGGQRLIFQVLIFGASSFQGV